MTGFSLSLANAGNYQTGNSALGNIFGAYGDHFSSFTASDVPYATYDVYVYVASDGDNRDAYGTIGSETLSFKTDAASATSFAVNSTPESGSDPSGFSYGAYNVLEFTNVTGSSFTYNQTYTGQSVGMAGFEIVEAPEPSTWAMLLAGAMLMGAPLVRRQLRA